MGLREKLAQVVTWRVGDGGRCTVYAQPWFPDALQFQGYDQQSGRLKLKDLLHGETGCWNVGELIQKFGYNNCLHIVSSVKPPREEAGEDSLIFTSSTNGGYSVKKMYKHLSTPATQSQDGEGNEAQSTRKLWEAIWRKGDVLPRVRLFTWKLLHQAIPLGKILNSRTSRGDPMCATCGQAEEDVVHLLFHCPFARACWFAGPVSLRTDSLGNDLKEVLTDMASTLADEDWTMIVNCFWALWRCRNDRAYSVKTPTFKRYLKYLTSINNEAKLAATRKKGRNVVPVRA